MLRTLRSELVRLQRPRLLLGWLGLTAMFAVLVNLATFRLVADSDGPPANGPGVAFPTPAELVSSEGLVAGLSTGASFFGVVTLAFWAITAASDYQTGLIRLLVSAEPNRTRLLAGKVAALAGWTAIVTLLAVIVCVLVAPIGAGMADVSTSAWRDGVAGNLASAWGQLYAALLVWGVVGLAIAVLTRSSAIAIGAGAAYVLIVEAVVEAAVGGDSRWLPGDTLAVLADGGGPQMSFTTAVLLGTAYAGVALTATGLVQRRRDITD